MMEGSRGRGFDTNIWQNPSKTFAAFFFFYIKLQMKSSDLKQHTKMNFTAFTHTFAIESIYCMCKLLPFHVILTKK